MPTLPRGRTPTPPSCATCAGAVQPAQRIYYQHDANFNTTAVAGLVGSTWQVTQRYVYDPYGNVTVLNADWTTASSQIPLTQYLHQGGRLDPITGLYLFRHRDYSPTLGNWIEQDPLGYINGASRYQFAMDTPLRWTDPKGEKPGDKWYGYNDRVFQDRVHREMKDKGQPDFTKEELKGLYDEWKKTGKPNGEGHKTEPQSCPMPAAPKEPYFSFSIDPKTGEHVLIVGGVTIATGLAAWLIISAGAIAASPAGV